MALLDDALIWVDHPEEERARYDMLHVISAMPLAEEMPPTVAVGVNRVSWFDLYIAPIDEPYTLHNLGPIAAQRTGHSDNPLQLLPFVHPLQRGSAWWPALRAAGVFDLIVKDGDEVQARCRVYLRRADFEEHYAESDSKLRLISVLHDGRAERMPTRVVAQLTPDITRQKLDKLLNDEGSGAPAKANAWDALVPEAELGRRSHIGAMVAWEHRPASDDETMLAKTAITGVFPIEPVKHVLKQRLEVRLRPGSGRLRIEAPDDVSSASLSLQYELGPQKRMLSSAGREITGANAVLALASQQFILIHRARMLAALDHEVSDYRPMVNPNYRNYHVDFSSARNVLLHLRLSHDILMDMMLGLLSQEDQADFHEVLGGIAQEPAVQEGCQKWAQHDGFSDLESALRGRAQALLSELAELPTEGRAHVVSLRSVQILEMIFENPKWRQSLETAVETALGILCDAALDYTIRLRVVPFAALPGNGIGLVPTKDDHSVQTDVVSHTGRHRFAENSKSDPALVLFDPEMSYIFNQRAFDHIGPEGEIAAKMQMHLRNVWPRAHTAAQLFTKQGCRDRLLAWAGLTHGEDPAPQGGAVPSAVFWWYRNAGRNTPMHGGDFDALQARMQSEAAVAAPAKIAVRDPSAETPLAQLVGEDGGVDRLPDRAARANRIYLGLLQNGGADDDEIKHYHALRKIWAPVAMQEPPHDERGIFIDREMSAFHKWSAEMFDPAKGSVRESYLSFVKKDEDTPLEKILKAGDIDELRQGYLAQIFHSTDEDEWVEQTRAKAAAVHGEIESYFNDVEKLEHLADAQREWDVSPIAGVTHKDYQGAAPIGLDLARPAYLNKIAAHEGGRFTVTHLAMRWLSMRGVSKGRLVSFFDGLFFGEWEKWLPISQWGGPSVEDMVAAARASKATTTSGSGAVEDFLFYLSEIIVKIHEEPKRKAQAKDVAAVAQLMRDAAEQSKGNPRDAYSELINVVSAALPP